MYEPAEDNESTGLLRYLEQQLDALRASVFGLTEEQSRATPCRSALSIAGLLKHATHGMRGATARLTGATTAPDGEAIAAYIASFAPTPDESTVSLVAAFDAVRGDYLRAFEAADPASAASRTSSSRTRRLRAPSERPERLNERACRPAARSDARRPRGRAPMPRCFRPRAGTPRRGRRGSRGRRCP